MTVWVDAQLSPRIAEWISAHLSVTAYALRELGLRDAAEIEIFRAARAADAVVMTKDSDFVRLLEQHGPPPKVIWLTCGNTSTGRLQSILTFHLRSALTLLEQGEAMVEIGSS